MTTHRVCLSFDFDAWSGMIARGMKTPTPVSRGEFGVIAADRILKLLEKHRLVSSWYIPGVVIATYPDLVRRIADEGHEIGNHGWTHVPPANLSPEKEEEGLIRTSSLISDLVGKAPIGYRSPSWDLSPVTIDLLLRNGFLYDSSMMGNDYSPYFARAGDVIPDEEPPSFGRETTLVEMPISWTLDDYPHFEFVRTSTTILPGLMNAHAVEQNWIEDFEYMARTEGGILTYTFHPFVIGRGHRMMLLERLIARLQELGATFCTVGQAATAFAASPETFGARGALSAGSRQPLGACARQRTIHMLDREMFSFRASDGLELCYAVDDFTNPWDPTETVLLLHAAMGSSRRMHFWVPHLARDFRVVRPDLRGHGKSALPGEGQLSLERVTEDIVDLLDHLGVERAHLTGSSAGGVIALNAAIRFPDRVSSVAAFAALPGLKMSAGYTRYDTWVDRIGGEGIAAFLRDTIETRFDLSTVSSGFVDWFIEEAARNDVDLLRRFVSMMAAADVADDLGKISCPALAVVPSGDPIHRMEQYQVLRERIADCEFIVYEGLPHNITDAVPDLCAADLRKFLHRVTGRT